jgi:hypothetical protein
MADEKRLLKAVVKCQHDGFGFDLTAEVYADEIPRLIDKLRAVGVVPANSPYVWEGKVDDNTGNYLPINGGAPRAQAVTGPAPLCPAHGKPMKASKHRSGEFYCSAKIGTDPATGTGIYCTEKMTLTGATA